MPGTMGRTASAIQAILLLLQLCNAVRSEEDDLCKAGHYYDAIVESCRPCYDICNPLRDTMTNCKSSCPVIYCSDVCDTTKIQISECFGKTCQAFAHENVDFFPKNATKPPGPEIVNAATPMFSDGGIAVFVGTVIGTAAIFFLGGFFTRGRVQGVHMLRKNSGISQEAGHDPLRDEFLQQPPRNGTYSPILNGGQAPPPTAV